MIPVVKICNNMLYYVIFPLILNLNSISNINHENIENYCYASSAGIVSQLTPFDPNGPRRLVRFEHRRHRRLDGVQDLANALLNSPGFIEFQRKKLENDEHVVVEMIQM